MARVELSAAAVEDLDALIASHELPPDTLRRVVYTYIETDDRVVVVTVQDARRSSSATTLED